MFLVEYRWSISILDLVEYYLCPSDAFSKASAKYLGGSNLTLVKHLCLSDVFYLSSICIKGSKTKLYIFFFSCVLREKVSKRKSLCIKNKHSFLKNKFAMLSDSKEGQNLSKWF